MSSAPAHVKSRWLLGGWKRRYFTSQSATRLTASNQCTNCCKLLYNRQRHLAFRYKCLYFQPDQDIFWCLLEMGNVIGHRKSSEKQPEFYLFYLYVIDSFFKTSITSIPMNRQSNFFQLNATNTFENDLIISQIVSWGKKSTTSLAGFLGEQHSLKVFKISPPMRLESIRPPLSERKKKSDTMVRIGLSSLNYRFSVSLFRLSYPPDSGTQNRQDPSFLFI